MPLTFPQYIMFPHIFQLRPADDLLPDLTAEALHSLSHAYHALSDVTTNFRTREPRLNVLPAMSPVPPPLMRSNTSSSQSQSHPPSSSASQTTTGIPNGVPFAFGPLPGNTGVRLRTGRGLGPTFFRPGVNLRPGSGLGTTLGSRNGLSAGIGIIPGNAGLGASFPGSPVTSVPATTTLTTTGNVPAPQNSQVSRLSAVYACKNFLILM